MTEDSTIYAIVEEVPNYNGPPWFITVRNGVDPRVENYKEFYSVQEARDYYRQLKIPEHLIKVEYYEV
jgi:hypothetical protein